MNISIQQLGIQKLIRVHTMGNGDLEEELINKQWECEHDEVETISSVENDPLHPEQLSLHYSTIYICANCEKELDYDEF